MHMGLWVWKRAWCVHVCVYLARMLSIPHVQTLVAVLFSPVFLKIVASLHTAAANGKHNCWVLHWWNPLLFLHFLFLNFFIFFTHNNQNHLQLISRYKSSGTDSSSFCLFPCSLSSLSSLSLTQALLSGPRNLAHSEKHSWKAYSPPDQGDFLTTHSLFFPLIRAHCFFLLLFACFKLGNIHA